MLQLRVLLSAFCLLCQVSTGFALFHHRAYHNAIIVGNYLYIDGGEITSWNGIGDGIVGVSTDSDLSTLPDNNTYSIDLSSGWTNSSVEIITIEKSGAPVLNGGALWLDASKQWFYAYDGGVSPSIPAKELPSPPANSLWQFTPDGNAGSWSNVPLQPGSNFTSLLRLELGTYASGDGLGYALGGYESWRTTTALPDYNSYITTPGMVIYNTTSQAWLNVSTSGSSGYSQYGWSTEAAAWFVPTFGPAGLLAVLGGQTADGVYNSLDYIYLFDPVTQSWSYQKTSGTSPSGCIKPCMVGAEGDNNTYELFFYGGGTGETSTLISNGAVYVLSLPSFNWQKEADTPSYGRTHHICNVVGTRQMMVVGGKIIDATQYQYPQELSIPDPWDKAIGVFDMTELRWKDSYEVDTTPYITPNVVKDYYKQHGRYPDSWDSAILENWFTTKASRPSSSSTSGSPASTTQAPSQSSSPGSSPGSSPQHSDTGAIAGGVVGGVLGLLLVGLGGVWYLRRQRRQRRQNRQPYAPSTHTSREYIKPELDDTQQSRIKTNDSRYRQTPSQPYDDHGAAELSTSARRNQLDSQQIYEMPERRFHT